MGQPVLTDSVGLVNHWLYNSSSSVDKPAHQTTLRRP